jgi:hypothetical protein
MKRPFILALPAIVATRACATTAKSASYQNNLQKIGGRPAATNFPRVAILAFLLCVAASSWGQIVGGAVTGTVRDTTGAAVPDATVTITNLETRSQRTIASSDVGRYSIPSVAIGHYEVKVIKNGFQSQLRTGIDVVIGQTAVVDVTLSVGNVQEEVSVDEIASPVIVSTQESSGLVSERQVKDLPLNGRSYDELLALNPTIVNYTSERSGGVGTSNSAVGNMFAVSGHRPQDNLFLMNGIEYTGASEINVTPGGTSGQLLGVDAVREFNVVSDTYGAEYGKRTGAQVSIVTASGTNQLHGSVYEFLRNSALDARNYFDQGSIPQFQRNVFGGSIGGPLKKNKLFLFGNYEGYVQHLGLSDVTLVPDNQARQGYVPNSSGTLTHVGVAPAVVPLLSLWPVQNGPELGGGIAYAYSHPLQAIREDFGTTRLDYNISNKDSLFGAYTIDDSAANTPSVNPLSLVAESLREQVFSIQEQHVISPTFLNTARFGFSRASFAFTGTTPVNLPGWVQGKPIGAVVVGGGTALNGASQISLAGTNAGSNLSAARNLFTLDDHIVLSKGIHQIEAGVWFQWIQANDNLAQYQYGQASFGSLTSFLQGTVSTFTVVPAPTRLNWRSLEIAGFIQDVIRVNPKLEMRIGLRIEGTNGWNEAHGRASNYLFDSNHVIETNPRVANSVFTNNRAKFLPEPRVSLSWDPIGKGRTVINAGFGMYNALLDNIDYRLDQTAPFNTTQALKNVPVSSLHIVPGSPLPSGSLISPSGIQPDAYTPTMISYTLKVQQQITANMSLSVGYVGSHGYHQMLSEDVNEPVPTICPASPCPATLPAGIVYYPKGAPLANPNLANTTTWISEGVSSYNGLVVDVRQNMSHGLQFRGVYTYSKSLDDGTAWNSSVGANAPGFVMFPLDPKLDWGSSNSDVRHLGVISGTYELPIGAGRRFLNSTDGWRKQAVTGWSASVIETLQSGFPFTPQLGFNPTNNGDSRNPIRPSWNPAFTGSIITGTPQQYFDPNAFIVPPAGTYGNTSRNSLVGPGMAETDLSFLKATKLSERFNLQFRAEFFNIFNHTNFGTPNPVVFTSASAGPSPTAGLITYTRTTSRQIQFGLKLLF